ncbi:MAG: phosphatase PAP2 family protein [Candidatus Kapabacteria bacterium]|nr:phosphatase PAP2 family protein [Candidatus Kapabacteria bacterium]
MNNLKQKIFKSLSFIDIYTILMLCIYIITDIILFSKVDIALNLLIINVVIIFVIIIIAIQTYSKKLNTWQLVLRKFYLMPVILYIYNQIFYYIKVVNPILRDKELANIDKLIFGISPSYFLNNFANPILTEYLQLTYFLFYFYPVIIGADLILQNKKKELYNYAGLIFFSFYFSYILYFLIPAIGPRFYLHDFAKNSIELPGLFLSEIMRGFINAGGGILPGQTNPSQFVNADCFPSGHTMMTMITMIIAFRYNSRIKWVVAILGSSLIFSTVYLRYHYVVDLVAGAFFCIIALYLEPKLKAFLLKLGLSEK